MHIHVSLPVQPFVSDAMYLKVAFIIVAFQFVGRRLISVVVTSFKAPQKGERATRQGSDGLSSVEIAPAVFH